MRNLNVYLAFMEHLKKSGSLRNKKTLAAIIGALLLFIAIPLTVIGTLQFKEGTQHLKTKAAVTPIASMPFPRVLNYKYLDNNSDFLFNKSDDEFKNAVVAKNLDEYLGYWMQMNNTSSKEPINGALQTTLKVLSGEGARLSANDEALIREATTGPGDPFGKSEYVEVGTVTPGSANHPDEIALKANEPTIEINSFEECAEAGYPILQTYPAQCKTPDGRTFTQSQTR